MGNVKSNYDKYVRKTDHHLEFPLNEKKMSKNGNEGMKEEKTNPNTKCSEVR